MNSDSTNGDRTVNIEPLNSIDTGHTDNSEDISDHWREKKDEGVWYYVKRIWYLGGQCIALAAMTCYLMIYRNDLSSFEKQIMIYTAAGFNLREIITFCYTQRNRYIQSKGLIGLPIGWFLLFFLPAVCYNLSNIFIGGYQKSNRNTWDIVAVLSLILSITGHIFNSFAELQRKWFLDKPENQNKLYTKGLFGLCRHPNYFGDLLIFCGWYLLSRNWIPFILPIIMLFSFYKEYIPEIEDFLSQKYGEQWIEYKKNVKPMIPFLC